MMCDELLLRITSHEEAGHRFHVLRAAGMPVLAECFVAGVENSRGGREVVNAIIDRKKAPVQREWKLKVADAVRHARSLATPPVSSAVSIAFFICPANHWSHRYDIENFVKPVIDGVAMGLWGDLDRVRTDPAALFDADDSVFRSIYVEVCDVEDSLAEGAFVTVSALYPEQHSRGDITNS